jgi:hypothetical protein
MPDRQRERDVARYLDWVTAPVEDWVTVDVDTGPSRTVGHPIRGLLDDPNIVGLGAAEKHHQGEPTGEVAFTIYVKEKRSLDDLDPDRVAPRSVQLLDGSVVPTDVEAIGEVFLEAGTVGSGESIRTNAGPGTIAGIVRRNGTEFLLTNRHVLSPSGAIGAAAFSPADDQRIGQVVGVVDLVRGIDFPNEVDAGTASIDPERGTDVSLEGPFGQTDVSIEPFIGMRVAKLGAQTGLTSSEVLDAHFFVRLPYPGLGVIGFRHQIKSRKFTDHGDSGSIVWDESSGSPVGLHFAGTSQNSLANPIASVLRELAIELVSGS